MPLGEEPEGVQEEGVSVEELGGLCADVYLDAFNALGSLYVGADVELPEKRAQRRGMQIAVVLRKAGWDDDEILCYVGLAAGCAGDLAIVQRAKAAEDAKRAKEKPASVEGASHVGGAPA